MQVCKKLEITCLGENFLYVINENYSIEPPDTWAMRTNENTVSLNTVILSGEIISSYCKFHFIFREELNSLSILSVYYSNVKVKLRNSLNREIIASSVRIFERGVVNKFNKLKFNLPIIIQSNSYIQNYCISAAIL